jgi:alpha-amylase
MENVFMVPDDAPCPVNLTMFQGFEWYIPPDHQHWHRLAGAIPSLAAMGITSMWIPPATKAASSASNGYDIYDLYDLGEFQQKGARHTKWGTKEELVKLVHTASSHGIGILFDAVLNHKTGADHTDTVVAVKVDPEGYAPLVGWKRASEAWLTVSLQTA